MDTGYFSVLPGDSAYGTRAGTTVTVKGKKTPKKKRAAGGPAKQGQENAQTPSNFLLAGGGRNIHRAMHTHLAEANRDLQAANGMLTKELAREKAEHDLDIADAHKTIQSLQRALAHTRQRLAGVEGETSGRIEEAARAVEELRTQLNEEQVLRRGEDREAAALGEALREAKEERAALRERAAAQEAELAAARKAHGEAAAQLHTAEAALSGAQARETEASEALQKQQVAAVEAQSEVQELKSRLEGALDEQRASDKRCLNLREDLAESRKRVAAHEKEGVRVAQQLELQQGAAAEARDELQAARAENKDLIAQRTRDAAAVAAAEDMRRQWEAAQMERGALESAMAARTAEVARLQADNARYASEWECREKSLVSSHELRVQHLLADLATRDKHAGELHNSLHRATVELQAHRGELQSARHELEATRDKLTAAEGSASSLQDEVASLQQRLREREGELDAAQRAHAAKAAALHEDLTGEHRQACDAQARCEALTAQLRDRDETCSRQAREHRDTAHEHEQQVRKLTAAVRELGEDLAESRAACEASTSQAAKAAAAHVEERTAAQATATTLKAALEASAASLEARDAEVVRLKRDRNEARSELERARAQLAAEREEVSRFAAEARAIEEEHVAEAAGKERMLQDCLAAMQGEEAAKVAAQGQLRACREHAARLEQEAARGAAALDEALERGKDVEAERDEARAAAERARKQADEARRHAESQRRQLEADLRAAHRTPASGRAHDMWRSRSARALEHGGEASGAKGRSVTASARGGAHESDATSASGDRAPFGAAGELSSYQKRLAEIRAKR